LEEKDEKISQLENDKIQLQQEIEQLRTQIDSIAIPEDKSEVYGLLFNATEAYFVELAMGTSERDYTAVADSLANLNDAQFEIEASVKLLSRLREATYPDAAKTYYKEGHTLYSDGKYEEALVALEKAMTYDPADVDAVYFTARSYHRLGDKPKAALYYNIVITDFPDSSRTSDAEEFVEQVQDN
jgi:tetratricopeptide (TPR) repeat protein